MATLTAPVPIDGLRPEDLTRPGPTKWHELSWGAVTEITRKVIAATLEYRTANRPMPTKCPYCGKTTDVVTHAAGVAVAPKVGAALVCSRCNAPVIFTGQGFRSCTSEELTEMAKRPSA